MAKTNAQGVTTHYVAEGQPDPTPDLPAGVRLVGPGAAPIHEALRARLEAARGGATPEPVPGPERAAAPHGDAGDGPSGGGGEKPSAGTSSSASTPRTGRTASSGKPSRRGRARTTGPS